MAGEALVAAKPSAVLNAAASISGTYPNLGPQIIVAAGAYHSPALLQRSGIGAARTRSWYVAAGVKIVTIKPGSWVSQARM